jgi:hypothetical protein
VAYSKNGIVYADHVGETINLFDSSYTSTLGAVGSDGNDMLRGNTLSNTLDGGAGDDQLWGGTGGNDTMAGGAGVDAYWWGLGDSHDIVTDTTANKGDAIILYNVQRTEYGAVNSQGNFHIIARDGSTLDLLNWYAADSATRIQSFVYADKIAYAWNDGKGAEVNLYKNIYVSNGVQHVKSLDSGNCTLRGAASDDLLEGGNGNDQLWGGKGGRDTMAGGAGADIYWWGKYDGNDTITSDFSNIQDTIKLHNVGQNELTVSMNGNDCILQVGTESLTVKNWASFSLDTLQFADGSTASLKALAEAAPADHQFSIEFDYSKDYSGFFSNHPERQRALEAAAAYWTKHIQDDFPTVDMGELFYMRNPQTDKAQVTISGDIDDLKIYVGAKDITDGSTAYGGSAVYYNTRSTDTLYQRFNNRTQFQPWAGSITFDSAPQYAGGETASWWYDPTPEDGSDAETSGYNQYDFVTVAIHEIGHVLGLSGGVPAFSAQKDPNNTNSFIGSNAVAANDNRPISLLDGTHPDGYNGNFSQEVVMAYGGYSYVGHRVEPSSVDLGMLSDIGYHIV